MITLVDTSLRQFSLDNLPLISKLRKQHFNTQTEVCIERAELITKYLKNKANNNIDNQLTRAKAINYYLSNRKPCFFDDNLLGGSTSSKAIGAPIYPEFMGLSIWPELDTIGTRKNNPQLLSDEEKTICNLDIFPYWMDKTVLEVARQKFDNPVSMQLLEKIVYYISGKAGCISHCVPDYSRIINEGADAIIQETKEKEKQLPNTNKKEKAFYQSVQIALKGLVNYAENISKEASKLAKTEKNPERKKNLNAIANVCGNVPAKPAKNFREAVNSLWLSQVGIHAENINMAMSPGRLDQVLYPYYKKDKEENEITDEEALNLCCCLYLKIADNTNLVPEAAEKLWGGAGSTPAVTLGGIDRDGNDAVNDLSYLFLKTTEIMRLRDPSVNARYNYKVNTEEYRQRVTEVIINTKAIPAFHNDITDIETLENQGVSTEDAREYAIVGCVELASTGKDYVASGSIMFNLYSALELSLFNGRNYNMNNEQVGPLTGEVEDFNTYDDFYKSFKKQLRWLLEKAIDMNEKLGSVHQEMVTTPLLSTFFKGPMDSGKDLVNGGALYNSSGASFLAYPDVCDSLVAIEQTVFIDKKYSFAEIKEAIQNNFEGKEEIRLFLKNKTAKFGNEDEIAVRTSRKLVKDIYEILQSKKNYRGGTYRPAFWTMTTHAGQGKLAGAMPSGRKAKEVFSSGITPSSQAAPDLIGAFNAVAKLDNKKIPGGWALNIKYSPINGNVDKETYLKKFGDMIESFFRKGGMQVQFNIQDYKTLIDAKENPEKYPEMIVRVSGYSAYFKDLSAAMKDELITRTQYNLISGQSVELPDKYEQTIEIK